MDYYTKECTASITVCQWKTSHDHTAATAWVSNGQNQWDEWWNIHSFRKYGLKHSFVFFNKWSWNTHLTAVSDADTYTPDILCTECNQTFKWEIWVIISHRNYIEGSL